MFSVISLLAPTYPTAVVFAVKENSCLTSVFADGSRTVPAKVSPLTVFAGIKGSAEVGEI